MTLRDLIVKPQPLGILFNFLPSGEASDGVFFDATISVSHSRSAEVTKFPVEEGSDISDHRRKGPEQVTITGLLANTPSGLIAGLAQFADGSIWDSSRARETYAKLLGVYEAEEFCTLITSIELYEKGVLTSLVVDDDLSNGDAIRFTATWERIYVAKSEVVALAEEPGAPPKKAAADAGAKAAETPPPEDESLFRQGLRGARDFLKQSLPTIPAPL